MKKKEEKRKKTKRQNKIKIRKKLHATKYVPIEAAFGNGEDYYVYRMTYLEKGEGGFLGFMCGFLVSMIFFRNLFFSLILGVCLIIPGIQKYKKYLNEKRLRNLLLQFRDMMESLAGSYSAGKNTESAFQDAYADMTDIYGQKSDIVHEIGLIVNGMYNGQNLNRLLENFAQRSHLDDIESFATIFEVSSKYGGNLKKVVGDTHRIISDKIEIEMEIQTLLTGNKNELRIMMLMPLIIMISLSGMGSMSIVENTPVNVLVKLLALAMFGAAYGIGNRIVNIKV